MVQIIPPELRHKFTPQLLAQIEIAGTPVKVIVTIAPTIQLAAAAATIASLGGRIEFQSELTNQISLTIDDAQLPALASQPWVQNLFHVPRGQLLVHRGFPHAGIAPVTAGIAAVTVTLEDTTTYVGAPRLWDRGFRGQDVKVGVVDTGIDKTHPMLESKVVAERSFAGGGTTDNNGHGTWVSSALAGKEWMSPQGPMIGVAPEASIVNAKAFEGDESDLDVIMAAMEWATLQGCHVLNNSWGTPEDYPPLHTLVLAIRARGVVIVAAAGNAGPLPGTIQFPGGYVEVIAVGSVATSAPAPDAVAQFSSRGPAPGGLIKPDLCAPGGTEEECIFAAAPGGGTDCFRGTSMATPHVSGAVALLLSAGQSPQPPARDIGAAGPDNDSGFGVLSFAEGAPIPPRVGYVVSPEIFAPLIAFGVITFLVLGVALSP